MISATIKLFLPKGDSKSIRTAEISNWSGKAVAAPRTELDELLVRGELDKAGIYFLLGSDPPTNKPRAYIGEAEIIRDRLKKQNKNDWDWISAIVFVSKDENLTKAHVRYLEGKLIEEATKVGRFLLENGQASGSKLPESDREDMEVFLARIRQLLPVLGTDLLVPLAQPMPGPPGSTVLYCRAKGAEATGQRTPNGFVIFQGSLAVLHERPAAAQSHPFVLRVRKELMDNGTLVERNGFLVFTKNSEFSSPSTAAAVVQGGGANGLLMWKTKDGKTLKELDEWGSQWPQ
jgi:hypothetical protein